MTTDTTTTTTTPAVADPSVNGHMHEQPPIPDHIDFTCVTCGAHDTDANGPYEYEVINQGGIKVVRCKPCHEKMVAEQAAGIEQQVADAGNPEPPPEAQPERPLEPLVAEVIEQMTIGPGIPPSESELYAYSLTRIAEAEKACRDAYRAMEQAKKAAKTAKAHYEELCGELGEIILEETGKRPRSLFTPPATAKPAQNETKTAQPETITVKTESPTNDDGSWREVPLASLGLPKGLLDKLTKVGIETIGKLQEYQEPTAGGWIPSLADIKGIGEAALNKLTVALDHFWAERAKKQQIATHVHGAAAATPESADGPRLAEGTDSAAEPEPTE